MYFTLQVQRSVNKNKHQSNSVKTWNCSSFLFAMCLWTPQLYLLNMLNSLNTARNMTEDRDKQPDVIAVKQSALQLILRARASTAIARSSYGNSVCKSVCPSVTTRYQFKPRWDRDFKFSPYNSSECLVFCDKVSCWWVRGSPWTRG